MVLLSVKSIKGRREYMEDRYAYLSERGVTIAMVCDGHGGYNVAEDTANTLPKLLLDVMLKTAGSNIKHAEALRNVISTWGKQMSTRRTGSTLTGIAVKNGIVYIYNIGDSRTCMPVSQGNIYHLEPMFDQKGEHIEKLLVKYQQSKFFCTIDHDADSPIEQARVVAQGGKITADKRLNGILSVTRALGDADVGPGVGYIPDIYWLKKEMVSGPILMYSDGIYELQRSRMGGEQFNDHFLYQIARKLGSDVLVRHVYEHGSDDNLTAMLVRV